MVHILLMILKIAGIILLVLLGIVLTLVLLVLLVPLRYRLKAGFDQKPEGFLRVSWLLHAVSYRAEYNEKGLVQALRIFGLRIWNSEADSGEVKDGVESALSREEQELYEELRQEGQDRRESGSHGPERRESGSHGPAPDTGGDVLLDDDILLGAQSLPEDLPQDTEPEREGVFSRIMGKIRRFFKKLRFSFRALCGKLRDIQKLIQDGRSWLENEKNQASIRLLLRQARRLLRHIFPLKGHGSVTFGFDDPYNTGRVLSAVSPFYPFYHKILEIHPVFDRSVLLAQGDLRGRIRLVTLLWLVFLVYRDKHTWRLIRRFIK